MKRAMLVVIVLGIILSYSSANAFCRMSETGKVTNISPLSANGTGYRVDVLQEGTTVTWSAIVGYTSPFFQLLATALAGGLSVQITGDAATCQAPAAGTTTVSVGNITAVLLKK